MSCCLILLCALWLMINWNQYFLTVPIRFINRRNTRDSESGIGHVFTIVLPALVTVCILVICFFPHLIISRFDYIPCSTPVCSSPLSLLYLENVTLVIATILISGTAVLWFRRMWGAVKNAPLLYPVYDKRLQVKLNSAITATERSSGYKLTEVEMFSSSASEGLQCFTKGWLRPKIWLSDALVNEMDVEDLRVILAHEHCHVLRYDNLVSKVLTFVSDVSWAHFGCRTLLKGWYERRELFCDNFSARVVGSRQKVASTLVKLTEFLMERKGQYATIPDAAYYLNMIEGKHIIQVRVENLLFPRCRRDAMPCVSTYRNKLWSFALFGLCILVFVTVVSASLASDLTYMHCLMEDVFSLHCSAC